MPGFRCPHPMDNSNRPDIKRDIQENLVKGDFSERQEGLFSLGGGIPTLFADGFIQFLTAVLLFVALLYRQSGLITLALLILLTVNGARLWSRLGLAGLEGFFHLEGERIFPAEKITIKIRLENKGIFPVWSAVRLSVGEMLLKAEAEGALGGKGEIYAEGGLLWKQGVNWEQELFPPRRGCYKLGPAKIISGDPFGFFQREKSAPFSAEVVVYPRLLPLKDFLFLQEEFFGNKGSKSPVYDPVSPVATRDYLPGRPARFIHWKASARLLRLQEKIFEPTTHGRALLAVEVRQFAENAAEESFERTLEVTASLAVALAQRGWQVGALASGAVAGGKVALLPPAGGAEQISALLELLGRLKMEKAGSLEELLRLEQRRQLSRGTLCICFFLKDDPLLLRTEKILEEYKISGVFVAAYHPESSTKAGRKIYTLEDLIESFYMQNG